MRKLKQLLLLVLILAGSGTCTFAQQADYWFFGQGAGLHFPGSGSPVAITGSLYTDEGCASISDASGNLLFYTDGTWVWDATHTIINSSTPLLGNSSSTQSAIIVPKPASLGNYYIFTQDEWGLGSCTDGLNYTEINVSGSTVSIVGTANINLLPCSVTTEKVTAVCHGNGTDYWVLTVCQNGDFLTWPVTSAGVGASILSPVTASPTTGNDDKVGYMKISNQGDHLVLGRRQWNSVNEAFDFNKFTGMVTLNRGTYHTGTVYGVEFSQNGNYFFTVEDFLHVVQYDFYSLSTFTTLHSTVYPARMGALQMGPDANIYVSNGYEGQNGTYLDQISNTNTFGATYTVNYITLAGGTYSRLGLPDIVNCFTPHQDCKLQSDFSYVFDPMSCAYLFNDMSVPVSGTTIVSWLWTFGDGTSSTLQNPTHYYSAPGLYNVCLTVTGYDGKKCCVSTFCKQVQIRQLCEDPCKIAPEFQWSIDPCKPCTYNFNGFTVFANREVVAWLWDFGDGSTASGQNVSHTYTAPGVYNVCLTVIARTGPGDDCCVFKICKLVQVNCGKPGGGGSGDNPDKFQQKSGKPAPASKEIPVGQSLEVYPNPAQGNITLQADIPSAQVLKIKVMDMTGKVHYEGSKEAQKGMMTMNVELGNIPQGIYMVLLEGRDIKLTQKVQIIKN